MNLIRNSVFWYWSMANTGLGTCLSGALLAGGIGMLSLKQWARVLSLVSALASIATGVLTLLTFVFGVLVPALHLTSGASAEKTGEVIGGIIGVSAVTSGVGCIGLIYPIILLCLLNTRTVKQAFQSSL